MTILEDIINMAKANGYKVLKDCNDTKYAFLVTPNGNVLSITEEYFGGCNIALKYVPSREHGTGCAAYDPCECPVIFTMSMIEQKEKELVAWAKRMKAKFYNSPDDFVKHYEEFYKTKLEEVT